MLGDLLHQHRDLLREHRDLRLEFGDAGVLRRAISLERCDTAVLATRLASCSEIRSSRQPRAM